MGYHGGIVAEASIIQNRNNFRSVCIWVVAVAIVRITHAGQIHGCDGILIRQLRRNEIPPPRVGIHAVDQQHAWLTFTRIEAIHDITLVHFYRACFSGSFYRLKEPLRYGGCGFASIPARHYSRPNLFRW